MIRYSVGGYRITMGINFISSKDKIISLTKHSGILFWKWDLLQKKICISKDLYHAVQNNDLESVEIKEEEWIASIYPRDIEKSSNVLRSRRAGNSDKNRNEIRLVAENRDFFWVEDYGVIIKWSSQGFPELVSGVYVDINKNKDIICQLLEENKRIKKECFYDALTKIPNRKYYEEVISHSIALSRRSGEHLSVLMIDIDFFKSLNDEFGHEAGDNALCLVSRTIKDTLTRETDFVARYGGEEFAVILQITKIEGAIVVANKIIKAIHRLEIKNPSSNYKGLLTLSIGIACSSSVDYSKLMRSADKALYKAKSNGRNMYEIYI